MARYLIVNADDFGLTEGVSRGIIRAHQAGILTSTTFMANFPWAPEMAPMLAEAPELGVGIHLNLTTGTPVLPAAEVPTLVGGEGRFSRSLLRTLTRVDLGQVRREWAAQIERGTALLGRQPTHLDTHRYLQGHPQFAAVMVDLAKAYGIPAVRCLYAGPDLPLSQMFSAWNPARFLVERYLRKSAELIAGAGVAAPDTTLAGDFNLAVLLRKLERIGEGVTELVSHPGLVDQQLRELSSMQEHREVELAALTAPEARRKVEELGIRLVTFRHLAAGT